MFNFTQILPYLEKLFSQSGGSSQFGGGEEGVFQEPWQDAAQATTSVPFGQLGMGAPGGTSGGSSNPSSSKSGGAGSFVGSLVNLIGGNPYEKYEEGLREISPELESYFNKATGYLAPYQQAGVSMLPLYEQKIKQMSDPTAFFNQIMGKYAESPSVKFQKQQGLESLKNTAAATGYAGSGNELRNVLKFSQGLASQGQQQYLNNILGINTQAMGGLSNITGRGQQAGTQMGSWSMQEGKELANLMSQIAAAKAGSRSSNEYNIGGALGSLGKSGLLSKLGLSDLAALF